MLSVKVDEKGLTFEFREMWSDKLLFTDTFDHKDAKQIAEDMLVFLKHFEELEEERSDFD